MKQSAGDGVRAAQHHADGGGDLMLGPRFVVAASGECFDESSARSLRYTTLALEHFADQHGGGER